MNILCFPCIGHAWVLLLTVNGAPIILNTILGARLAYPVDMGIELSDGRRLFGSTKTWRGVVAAVAAAIGMAILFQMTAVTGICFGILAMSGDLLTSFSKRRLGVVESGQALGLDTALESLLPIVILREPLGLDLIGIVVVGGLFFLTEELVSPLLYRWHIRNRPY